MSWLLYFLAGTNLEVLKQCRPEVKQQQLLKGVVNGIGALLVAALTTYCLYIISNSILIASLGLITGIFSILFNRFLFSAPRQRFLTLSIGIVESILFAFLFSVTLQLALFDSEIKAELFRSNAETVFRLIDQNPRVQQINSEIYDLENSLEKLQSSVSELESNLLLELKGDGPTRKSGAGAYFLTLKDMIREKKLDIDRLSIQINDLRQTRQEQIKQKEKVADIYTSLTNEDNINFLSRIEALNKIKDSSNTILLFSWAINLALFSLVALPYFILYMEPRDEYNIRLEETVLSKHKVDNSSNKEKIAFNRFRFSLPTFSKGFATALDWNGDLGPKIEDLYSDVNTPEEADTRALGNDWKAVGDDLAKILKSYEPPKHTREEVLN